MKVSLIITTRNEEGCIGKLLTEVPKKLVDEIIVVDGHSTDNTAREAKQLLREKKDKFILQKKAGYGNAVMQGFNLAKGDILVIMCGDGSDNPKYIKDFISRINQGYEYVRASRYMKGAKSDDDTWITLIGNKILTLLTNLVHRLKVSDALYIYSAISKKGFKQFKLDSCGFEITIELLIKSHREGLKFVNIPVAERKRFAGRPKINSFLDGLKILKSIFRDY